MPLPDALPDSLVVTGANGHLGLNLFRTLGRSVVDCAVVRSERAAGMLAGLPGSCHPRVQIADPADPSALADAARGAGAWIHLVGILKESRTARYADAHERSAESVRDAAARAGVGRIVYLSILGSDAGSPNACLASKGRAEDILRGGAVPATVLRVPMVLGPGEIAAGALRGKASAPFVALVRGGATLEQPIDGRDVVRAILLAAGEQGGSRTYDLAGPESLSHRELVARVARRLGKPVPRVIPVPVVAMRLLARAFELGANPPITRAMLGVLEHDDRIDPTPACERLGLELTPLDMTLDRTFAPEENET